MKKIFINNFFLYYLKKLLHLFKNIFLFLYQKNLLNTKAETFYKIRETQYMRCNIAYSFTEPSNRIDDYLRKYKISTDYYSVCRNSFLIGEFLYGFDSNLMPLIDSFPHKYFFKNNEIKDYRLNYKNKKIITFDLTICTLFFNYRNYFHWFIDNLPKIFAAENYEKLSGEKVYFLVPDELSEWALSSLKLMNLTDERVIKTNSENIISCRKLISRRGHRCQKTISPYYDAISPIDVKNLSIRLKKHDFIKHKIDTPKKLFLSRNDAKTRRVINQNSINNYLKNFGFEIINLEGIDLKDQIILFNNASHIISPHGAGLTNLIFCKQNTSIFEIHSFNHGIRSEYLQIASIFGLDYYYECVDSLDEFSNMIIPIKKIEKFIKLSKAF